MKKPESLKSKYFYIVFSFLFTFFASLIGITAEDIQYSFPLLIAISQPNHYITPVLLGIAGAFVGYLYWKNKSAIYIRLLHTEKAFRTYVEHTTDAYFLHDEKGTIFDFNKYAYKFLGYSEQEFIQLNYFQIDNKHSSTEKFKQLLTTAYENELIPIECFYKNKNETLLPVEIKVNKVFIDGQQLYLTKARDIADRKLKEEKLKQQFNQLQESELALKKANNDLFESKLHYQIIADYTFDWEYWLSPQGEFNYISPSVERITGYAVKEFVQNPKLYNDIIIEEDREKWSNHHNSAIERLADTEIIEFRIKNKNGEIIWIEHLCQPVYNSKEEYLGVRGSNRDATQKKMAELKIQQKNIEYKTLNTKYMVKNINLLSAIKESTASEERFKHLFNLTFEGIVIHKEGVAKEINNAFAKMFRYTADELIGTNIINLLIDTADHKLISENIKKNHAEPYEVRGIKKDGSKIPIELESRVISDKTTNNKLRVVSVRDLSFRKKAEREIKKLSTAVEQSANLIVITDLEGKVEYANQKFYSTTGYEKNEVVGNSTRLLKSDVHNRSFYKELWQTINSGKAWKGELCNKKKNGDLYWESAIITPVFNSEKEIVNFIAMKEDITEKKGADKKLLSAIIQTEEKERKKFAEDLHDELGPHMSGIRLYASTLKKNSNKPSYVLETAELIDEMVKEAIEITRTISNKLMPNILMDFGIEMALKSFCKRIADTNKIQFNLKLNELTRPLSQTIEIALYRICIELITNTLKYANASEIDIDLIQNNANIEFTYKDNGVGFNITEVLKGKKGLGLNNIINRIKTLESAYTFKSNSGKGIIFNIVVNLSNI